MQALQRLFSGSTGEILLQSIPFLAFEALLATHGGSRFGWPPSPLPIGERYWPALVTVNVTMAVFAVNFSFVEYQFSPYRTLLRRISPRQIAAAAGTLVLALLPLLFFAFGETWVPSTALLAAPVVAFASLILVQLSRTAVRPERILEQAVRKRNLQRFATEFVVAATAARMTPPEFRLTLGTLPDAELTNDYTSYDNGVQPNHHLASQVPPPLNEVEWRVIPVAPMDDPFATIVGVAIAAIQSGDAYTFELAVDYAYRAFEVVDKNRDVGSTTGQSVDDGAASALGEHALSCVERIGVAARELDKSHTFSAKFLSRCAVFLDGRPEEEYREPYPPIVVLNAMSAVAAHLLEQGFSQPALIPLVSARWLGIHGLELRRSRQNISGMLFREVLPWYPRTIQRLGEVAIRTSDSEYLYRALEALSWLGCAAVRANDNEVGSASLNGIVQLGRLARAAKLDCHWRRCPLAPIDHAWQHLESIISCAANLTNERDQEWWRVSLGEAFSRLAGTTHRLVFVTNTAQTNLIDTKVRHVVTFPSSVTQTLDYADEGMLKDFELFQRGNLGGTTPSGNPEHRGNG